MMEYNDYLSRVFSTEAFKGKVYGVTGGAHGIGQAIVHALTDLGASVLIIDLNAADLEYFAADLHRRGRSVETVVGDVSDGAMLADSIEKTAARFGRLNGWVNNAMLSPGGALETQDEFEFVKAWEVNVLAAWRSARLCLPHFRKAGGGSIVNISSIMAHHTRPNCAAYTSSKSALEGLTRALAVELAKDLVRVNAVAPGSIASFSTIPNDPAARSPYHLKRIEYEELGDLTAQPLPIAGHSTEIAGPVLFLLSEAAKFVTGVVLLSDGGSNVEMARDRHRSPEQQRQLDAMRDEMARLPGKTPRKPVSPATR